MISYTDQLGAIPAEDLVRSWDFTSEENDFGTESFGDNVGILDTGAARPEIDTVVKAPGTSASLKFIVPSNSNANSSGSWWMNFSSDLSVQFGAGQTFYVSWWQRFDSFLIEHAFAGGGGFKQVILSAGDKAGCTTSNTTNCQSSCTALELVVQNTSQRGFPQMYQSCTGCDAHGGFLGFEEAFGGSDFKLQNAMPDPFCLYSTSGSGFPGCFHYQADEWMLFQVRVTMGDRVSDGFSNSLVKMWAARENQEEQQLFEWPPSGSYTICAGSAGENLKYGKIWLLPYNTNKSAAEAHQETYAWYGGVIVSRSQIPMFSQAVNSRLVMVRG